MRPGRVCREALLNLFGNSELVISLALAYEGKTEILNVGVYDVEKAKTTIPTLSYPWIHVFKIEGTSRLD